jgi:hypothetical protein
VSGKPVVDGTVCGTDLVCRSGACVACVDGAACVPSAATCHTGKLSCGTTPSCIDAGGTADDGTRCGIDMVCSSAVCVGCVEGQVCMTGGECYYPITWSCSQGPICDVYVNYPDGAPCASGHGTCWNGDCRG